jgi:hypothetical protein
MIVKGRVVLRINIKWINSSHQGIKHVELEFEGEFALSLLPLGRPKPESTCVGRFEAMEISSMDWPERTKKSSSVS